MNFNADSKAASEAPPADAMPEPDSDPYVQAHYLKLSRRPKTGQIVTFLVGDTKLYAHKDILTARSRYFRSLFDSGMKESQTNEIPIAEAEPNLFQELLDFVYSGLPPKDLPAIAQSLLPLADRFGLLVLKKMCVAALISTLSLKNVIATLLLADTHSCRDLTKKCLEMMQGNIYTLKTTEDFKELKKNPEVLAMVLENFDDRLTDYKRRLQGVRDALYESDDE